MLFRLFPWVPGAPTSSDGGPLFVPRLRQGAGRHDNPARYGALYASRTPVGAVAEQLKFFVGRTLLPTHLLPEGRQLALAPLDDGALRGLIDLDEPRVLVERALRPSRVATHERRVSRAYALALYQDGATGLEWWSTLESSWINVTLFAERALRRLRQAGAPELLTIDHPAVVAAADAIGVRLAA